MLPVILGAVALGTVGYGIKKCVLDEECIDAVKDKISDGAGAVLDVMDNVENFFNLNEVQYGVSTSPFAPMHTLENFYALKEKVYNGVYKDILSVYSQIKNLDLKEEINIELKNNTSIMQSIEEEEITHKISHQLYARLYSFNALLEQSLLKITHILSISTNYKAYSDEARELISNTMVIHNIIAEILNIKVVSKKGKPTKSALLLAEESKKVLEGFKKLADVNT